MLYPFELRRNKSRYAIYNDYVTIFSHNLLVFGQLVYCFLSEVANTVKPPKVISMSYGSLETHMVASVYIGFDTVAIKLGMQGTTLFSSSGDDGVSPFYARSDGSKCGYVPVFPTSSPYVISVGGTIVSL